MNPVNSSSEGALTQYKDDYHVMAAVNKSALDHIKEDGLKTVLNVCVYACPLIGFLYFIQQMIKWDQPREVELGPKSLKVRTVEIISNLRIRHANVITYVISDIAIQIILYSQLFAVVSLVWRGIFVYMHHNMVEKEIKRLVETNGLVAGLVA